MYVKHTHYVYLSHTHSYVNKYPPTLEGKKSAIMGVAITT